MRKVIYFIVGHERNYDCKVINFKSTKAFWCVNAFSIFSVQRCIILLVQESILRHLVLL